MGFNGWIRQFHRWMSVLFVIVAGGIFATLGSGHQPVQWVYYLPLIPLALLTLTGVYMFALPYVLRSRGR